MVASAATDAASLMSALSQLVWPATVVLIIILFRKNLAAQVGRLQTVKAAGAEVTFADRVDQAVRESSELAQETVNEVAAARQTYLLRLASTDPVMAIRKGWEVVREAAQSQARRRQLEWTTTKDFAERMEEAGLLDSSAVRLIQDLRSLRYDLADQPQPDLRPATATAYVTAANSVANVLSSLEVGDQARGEG